MAYTPRLLYPSSVRGHTGCRHLRCDQGSLPVVTKGSLLFDGNALRCRYLGLMAITLGRWLAVTDGGPVQTCSAPVSAALLSASVLSRLRWPL